MMKKSLVLVLVLLLALPLGAMAECYGWTDGQYVLGNTGVTVTIPEGLEALETEDSLVLARTPVFNGTEGTQLNVTLSDSTDLEALKEQLQDGYFASFDDSKFITMRGGNGSLEGFGGLSSMGFMCAYTWANELSLDETTVSYAAAVVASGSAYLYDMQYLIAADGGTYIVHVAYYMSGDEAVAHKQEIESGEREDPIFHNQAFRFAEAILSVK